MPRHTIYWAFTSWGSDPWVVLGGAPGEQKEVVWNHAVIAIAEQFTDYTDIRRDTELKNLVVLSDYQARRRKPYRRALQDFERDED